MSIEKLNSAIDDLSKAGSSLCSVFFDKTIKYTKPQVNDLAQAMVHLICAIKALERKKKQLSKSGEK